MLKNIYKIVEPPACLPHTLNFSRQHRRRIADSRRISRARRSRGRFSLGPRRKNTPALRNNFLFTPGCVISALKAGSRALILIPRSDESKFRFRRCRRSHTCTAKRNERTSLVDIQRSRNESRNRRLRRRAPVALEISISSS